jgi:hypothetical protein
VKDSFLLIATTFFPAVIVSPPFDFSFCGGKLSAEEEEDLGLSVFGVSGAIGELKSGKAFGVGLLILPLGNSGVLTMDSGDFEEDSGNLMVDSGSFTEDSGDLMEDSGDFEEDSGNLMVDSGSFTEDSGDLMEDSGDLTEDSEVFTVDSDGVVPSSPVSIAVGVSVGQSSSSTTADKVELSKVLVSASGVALFLLFPAAVPSATTGLVSNINCVLALCPAAEEGFSCGI